MKCPCSSKLPGAANTQFINDENSAINFRVESYHEWTLDALQTLSCARGVIRSLSMLQNSCYNIVVSPVITHSSFT